MTVSNQVHGCHIQTVKDDKEYNKYNIFAIFPTPNHSICRAASFLTSTNLCTASLKQGQPPLSPQSPHHLHATDGDSPRKNLHMGYLLSGHGQLKETHTVPGFAVKDLQMSFFQIWISRPTSADSALVGLGQHLR